MKCHTFKKIVFSAVFSFVAATFAFAAPGSVRTLIGGKIVNGSAVLTLPTTTQTIQNIHTGATPTFAGINLPDSALAISKTNGLQSALDGKQASLGFTPEDVSNKDTTATLGTSDIKYPSQKAVKTYVDTGLGTKQATGDYITALTGDVTATGPGSVAATVASVAGSSAANVHSAELLANAATDANTASAIVKRDASGNFAAGTITGTLTGNVTGNLTGGVTGNVSGNLTGDVTGNVSGSSASFTGSLVGDVSGTQGATSVDKIKGVTVDDTAKADGKTFVYKSASGKYELDNPTAAGILDQSYELSNLAVSATVASNILTVSLKGKDGNDPSATNIVKAGFRNTTATTGTYTQQSFNAASGSSGGANNVILAADDSIGATTAVASTVYVYAVADGLTSSDVCASLKLFDEGSLQSASAITAGADTVATTLWCANAHTSKPVRLIAKLTAVWTSGTGWSGPTNVSLIPFTQGQNVSGRYYGITAGATLTSTPAALFFLSKSFDNHGVYSGSSVTCPTSGEYQVNSALYVVSNTWGVASALSLAIYVGGSAVSTNMFQTPAAAYIGLTATINDIVHCNAGQAIQIYSWGTSSATMTISAGAGAGANYFSWAKVSN